MAKKTSPKKNGGDSVNLKEPERFAKIRAIFEARGLAELPLSIMARIVFDEWISTREAVAPKSHG